MWWVNKVFNFVAARAAVIHRRVESTVQYIIMQILGRFGAVYDTLFKNAVVRWALFARRRSHREKMEGGKKKIWRVVRLKMSTIYSLYHRFYNTWLLFKFHLKPWTPVNGVKLVHGLNNLYLRFAQVQMIYDFTLLFPFYSSYVELI